MAEQQAAPSSWAALASKPPAPQAPKPAAAAAPRPPPKKAAVGEERALPKPKPRQDVSGRSIVLDAGAFIRGADLSKCGAERFYTTTAVMREIRDRQARDATFKQSLLHDVQERVPDDDSIKAVTAFAKKTGDHAALSATDLGIIALTYQIERECHMDMEHVRTDPPRARIQVGKKEDKKEEEEARDLPPPAPIRPEWEDVEDDGEGAWITETNLVAHIQKDESKYKQEVESDVSVACITTDYAMQNVLIQMNLKVLGVDGMMIKSTRQYVQKCQACGKITADMSKKFCAWCGNNTLYKVAVISDKEGNVVHYNARAPRSMTRGTKYPIPKPKGGRDPDDLILREDQYNERMQKAPRKKKTEVDVFDEDFQFGDQRQQKVSRTGRAAGRKGPELKVGYGRKNPNQARRGRRK